jgi:23S rRNA pseudouridine1911/1915/1917 synthase
MSSKNMLKLTTEEFSGIRLDKALPRLFEGHTRSFYEQLFDNELVTVNNKAVKKSYKLNINDQVSLTVPAPAPITLNKKEMPLEILFEDEHLIIINKQAGLVVHPAPGHTEDTLVNGLLHYCDIEQDEDETLRPGIVHRLDKDTSGLLITCKTKKAHEAMSLLFMNREIKKSYLAICLGKVQSETIEAPIARHKHFRQKMAVSFHEKAKNAITIAHNLYYDHEISLAKLDIITGRTHQIRVHMQHKKTPVLGDSVYGYTHANSSFKAKRQYLHAYSVQFTHPLTEIPMHIKAPLPEDMSEFLNHRKVNLPSLLQD